MILKCPLYFQTMAKTPSLPFVSDDDKYDFVQYLTHLTSGKGLKKNMPFFPSWKSIF